MPKMKTLRGAAKRFRKTATGRYKHKRSNRNHMMTSMKTGLKRALRSTGLVSKADTPAVAKMVGDK